MIDDFTMSVSPGVRQGAYPFHHHGSGRQKQGVKFTSDGQGRTSCDHIGEGGMVQFTETVLLPPGYVGDENGSLQATGSDDTPPVPTDSALANQERPVKVVFASSAPSTADAKKRAKRRSPSPPKGRLIIYTKKSVSELEEESRSSRESSATNSPVKTPSRSFDSDRYIQRVVRVSAVSTPQPKPPEKVVLAVLPTDSNHRRSNTLPRNYNYRDKGEVITARRVVSSTLVPRKAVSTSLQDTAPYSRVESGTIKLEFLKATPKKPPRTGQDPQLDVSMVTLAPPVKVAPRMMSATADENREMVHLRRASPSQLNKVPTAERPSSTYTMSKKETLINGSGQQKQNYYQDTKAVSKKGFSYTGGVKPENIERKWGRPNQTQPNYGNTTPSGRYSRSDVRKANQENIRQDVDRDVDEVDDKNAVNRSLSIDQTSPVRTSSRPQSPFRILQLEDSPQRRKSDASPVISPVHGIIRNKDNRSRQMRHGSPSKSESEYQSARSSSRDTLSVGSPDRSTWHSTPNSSVTSPTHQSRKDQEPSYYGRRHASLPRRFGSKNFKPRHHEVKITSVKSTVSGTVMRQGQYYPRHFNVPIVTAKFERSSKSDDDLLAHCGSSVRSDDLSIRSEPVQVIVKAAPPIIRHDDVDDDVGAPSARDIRAKLEKLSLEGRLGLNQYSSSAKPDVVESGVEATSLPSVNRVKRELFKRELVAARTAIMDKERSPISPSGPPKPFTITKVKPRPRVSHSILRLQATLSGEPSEEVVRKQLIKQNSMEVAREAIRRRENIRRDNALLEQRIHKVQSPPTHSPLYKPV